MCFPKRNLIPIMKSWWKEPHSDLASRSDYQFTVNTRDRNYAMGIQSQNPCETPQDKWYSFCNKWISRKRKRGRLGDWDDI